MGIYDMLVLAIVLATTFRGWRKGLATQIASIVSIAASFLVAVRFREPVAARIDADPPWNLFAAMLILYLGTSLAIWLVFRQVRTSIERMKLSEFDQQMGAVFGAVKGIALASVVTLFAFTLLQEPQRQAIIHSTSGVWIAQVIHRASAIMPVEVRQYIEPYLDRLDEGFGNQPLRQQYARPEYPPRLPEYQQARDPWRAPPPPRSDFNGGYRVPNSTPPPPEPRVPNPSYDYRPVRP